MELWLHTALRLPDETDELGGVLDVRDNPDADLEQIRRVCRETDLEERLVELLVQVGMKP